MPSHGSTLWPTQQKVSHFLLLALLENLRMCIFTNPNSNSCHLKIVLHPKSYIYAIRYTVANWRCSYKKWLMWFMHAQSEWCSQMSFCYKDVCKSISSGAHYVTLQKYFSHPSLVIYFFATPPPHIRTATETQEIGGRLLIANHLDQSLWWANEKALAAALLEML
jgi:hypothetical protein